MEGMYERTGLCPYTGECTSFRTIVKNERWMGKALSRIRREGASFLPKEEGGYSEESLVDKLEQLRRVKERCYSHNGRCLRFWQFERKKEDETPLFGLSRRLEVFKSIPVLTPPEDQVKISRE